MFKDFKLCDWLLVAGVLCVVVYFICNGGW